MGMVLDAACRHAHLITIRVAISVTFCNSDHNPTFLRKSQKYIRRHQFIAQGIEIDGKQMVVNEACHGKRKLETGEDADITIM